MEIIDYKPPYLSGHYNLWAVNNPVYDKPFVKLAYLLAKLPERIRSLKRKRAFDQFTRQYLKLTKRYNSYEELLADVPEADVYIAGSDQIWNTLFQNGRDKAFYLAFAPKDKMKISYAASFSTPDIKEEYRSFVGSMLAGLDWVSVREKDSLPLLASIGRSDGVAVCDPVFLLSKDEWERLLPKDKSFDSNYLLVYDTEGSEQLKDIAIGIASEKHLAIWNVSAFKFGYAEKNFSDDGPMKFVSLIRGASYVVSNSFHATAFALIYEKDFCVIKRSENINSRMECLLKDYRLSDRILATDFESVLNPIDYNVVRAIIQKDVHKSKHFLDFAYIACTNV